MQLAPSFASAHRAPEHYGGELHPYCSRCKRDLGARPYRGSEGLAPERLLFTWIDVHGLRRRNDHRLGGAAGSGGGIESGGEQ